jgi:hypothetical protein
MSYFQRMKLYSAIILALLCQIGSLKLQAVNTVLFNGSQIMQLTAEGTTSDTFSTEGYIITVTRDKLFTGGLGMPVPIGRNLRVFWPNGMEVQGVTSGPVQSKANLSIRRVDGNPFAITAFTVKLLASTAGAGGSIEVMPLIQGEDGLNDPVAFNVSGPYGYSFPPFTPTQFVGHNYDSYKFTLYVDYAIMSLTLVDGSQPPPPAPAPPMLSITQSSDAGYRISWPLNGFDYKLQTSVDLENGPWTPLVSIRHIEGDDNVVDGVFADTQRYFRLSN